MKGFIEVYDQRTQFLKDIFLSHGYQINDKQSQNLDFYVVKNQKIDHDNTFSLNNINTKYIINKDKVFKHLNNTLTAMGLYLWFSYGLSIIAMFIIFFSQINGLIEISILLFINFILYVLQRS